MLAVEISNIKKCVKIQLPNGNVVDVLDSVIEEICKWIQDDDTKLESGGYIVGYQHAKTGNISLEKASHPFDADEKSRISFAIRDRRHHIFLQRASMKRSYYMGVWHTHPQADPNPSSIDWTDWKESLRLDTTGCQYMFFIIAGTTKWKLWIGNRSSGEITEGIECPKTPEGIYIERQKN